MSSLRFVQLDDEGRRQHEAGIVELEADASYPLGTDRFKIDHGPDYFAFFDRLGAEERWVVIDPDGGASGRVVATASGVLRELRTGPAWYLCDLKVAPSYRGQGISVALGLRSLPSGLLRCRRGFGISMDPPARTNPMGIRVSSLTDKMPGSFRAGLLGRLSLFSLDEARARTAQKALQARKLIDGPFGWLGLRGVKDIVLESTGARMPLWHAHHGPHAATRGSIDEVGQLVVEPQPDGAHMISVRAGSEAEQMLDEIAAEPPASASVFHLGMHESLLDNVLSSEI